MATLTPVHLLTIWLKQLGVGTQGQDLVNIFLYDSAPFRCLLLLLTFTQPFQYDVSCRLGHVSSILSSKSLIKNGEHITRDLPLCLLYPLGHSLAHEAITSVALALYMFTSELSESSPAVL